MLRCNMYVPEDTLERRPAVDRFSPGGRVAAIDCAERALGCCVRGQPEGNLSFIGDLRRTGTTRLANNHCTEDELMSVTGHKSREVVSVYVKRSKAMAQSAIMKAWS